MNKPIRFGLLGYGLFGSHHAKAIQQGEITELAAITAHSETSRAAAADAFPDADILESWQQVLQREDVDVVDIVLPNLMHHEVALAALRAGKHVLLEKPMALTSRQCDELVAASERAGRMLAIGHELRLSSLWGGAKQLIDDGAIGKVRHVLVELSRFPYRPGSGGWRYDIDRVGSWILEEPIHFFDLAQWYLQSSGVPVSVYARANSRDPAHPELHDNFSSIVNYADGAYALVSQTLAAFGHHQTAKITGENGCIWATWSASDARSDRPTFSINWGLGEDVHEVELTKPAGELLELADEIHAVAVSARDGTPPPCTADDGRWATRLCLASEESIRRKGPVSIADWLATESKN